MNFPQRDCVIQFLNVYLFSSSSFKCLQYTHFLSCKTSRKKETLTLKALTRLMHVMGGLQLYSTVSIGLRVVRGMDAMDLQCVLTVRYDHILLHCKSFLFCFVS